MENVNRYLKEKAIIIERINIFIVKKESKIINL